jgi:hypothetical protein
LLIPGVSLVSDPKTEDSKMKKTLMGTLLVGAILIGSTVATLPANASRQSDDATRMAAAILAQQQAANYQLSLQQQQINATNQAYANALYGPAYFAEQAQGAAAEAAAQQAYLNNAAQQSALINAGYPYGYTASPSCAAPSWSSSWNSIRNNFERQREVAHRNAERREELAHRMNLRRFF